MTGVAEISRPLVLAAVLAMGAASPAAAGFTVGPTVDVKQARIIFTEALLDWCGRAVADHSFAKTANLDPLGPDWRPSDDAVTPARPRKGRTATPVSLSRTHIATGVIVELSADRASCLVQMEAPASNVLAAALKATLVRWPYSAVQVQTVKSGDGEGAVYAIRAGKDGPFLALSINEYAGDANLLTATLKRDPADAPPPTAAAKP